MPTFDSGDFVVPKKFPKLYVATGQEIVAAEHRCVLRQTRLKVGRAMKPVGRTKEHVVLRLLSLRLIPGQKITPPKYLHVGATVMDRTTVMVVGKVILVVPAVHHDGDTPLAHIALARGLPRLVLRPGQSRQQKRCQDGDYCDHHQQFDQGESSGSTGNHLTD